MILLLPWLVASLLSVADCVGAFCVSSASVVCRKAAAVDGGIDKVEDRVRYRGRVAYDGTSFQGWQVQKNERTVQGELEDVLSRRFDRSVKVVGAGRTDAGVHARGQTFQFDLSPNDLNEEDPSSCCLHQLESSMNRMLSRDVRVYNLSCAPHDRWHVIMDAVQKVYSYRITVGRTTPLDPLHRYTRVPIHDSKIDMQRLRSVLKHYEGTHDFRAFAGSIEANEKKSGTMKDTVRTVFSVSLVKEDDDDPLSKSTTTKGNYRIDFTIRGALYKMIRNMIGTAFDVCTGQIEERTLLRLLHHTNNNDGAIQYVRENNKSKPAPPEGLTLEKVFYEDDNF